MFTEELKKNGAVVGNIFTWKDLKADEKGEWVEAIGTKRGVLVSGEFNLAACKIEGSNDKINVGNLQQAFGAELNINGPHEFFEINGISRFIRPVISGGDEKTNLTVSIMVLL